MRVVEAIRIGFWDIQAPALFHSDTEAPKRGTKNLPKPNSSKL